LYEVLKQRGMSLVTVTDHDSIDAAEALRRHADFFISEEVTSVTPSGTVLHVGVYDITERQHAEIYSRRNDLLALLAYLSEKRIFYSINHPFSGLNGPRARGDFRMFRMFPAMEILNGQMDIAVNQPAQKLAADFRRVGIGGSDAHTPLFAGRTWTEVPGARNKQEFFDGLWHGAARAAGEPGGWWKLTRDVIRIATGMIREYPATALLSPLLLGIPIYTLGHFAQENRFARRWAARLSHEPQGNAWPFGSLGPVCEGETP
jgi:predicted metal-dependent phosphoesterase TrpH